MPHTYASVARLQDYLRDNGRDDIGQYDDALYLDRLEAASRRVDAYCARSSWGSGFGPRTGTNRYSGSGGCHLLLDDDLLAITSMTLYQSDGGTGETPVVDTDYYLDTMGGPGPFRRITLGHGSPARFGTGHRVSVIVGTWGYQDVRDTLLATVASGLAVSASATEFVTSAAPDFDPGDTLRIESEQLYVRAVDGTTITVDRGANGTTATTHANASAISRYRYPAQVVDATLAVATRRLRGRDAGLTPDYGGAGVPVVTQRDTERAILAAALGSDLHLPSAR